MKRYFRIGNVIVAWLLCVLWLFSLFVFGSLFDDRNGKDSLVWAMLASLGLLVQGVVLIWARMADRSNASLAFAVAVLVAPLIHYVGASINGLGCLPFFVSPSVAIAILGVRESIVSTRRETPPGPRDAGPANLIPRQS